jgi:hypothetical protein
MSEDTASLRGRVRKAAHLLLFKHHMKPGVKGWELRRVIGPRYREVVKLLDEELSGLDLTVKVISEEGDEVEEWDSRSRFYVTMREAPTLTEAKAMGWRVDDLGALAATLTYILSRQGKAPGKEVEDMLRRKFPDWKVDYNLRRFISRGYLSEDEEGMLYVGWRTNVEIDKKTLLNLLLGKDV